MKAPPCMNTMTGISFFGLRLGVNTARLRQSSVPTALGSTGPPTTDLRMVSATPPPSLVTWEQERGDRTQDC